MKFLKVILLFFIVYSVTPKIYAQFGVRPEIIFASLNGNAAFNSTAEQLGNSISSQLGYGLGVSYNLPKSSKSRFSIQTEINYSVKVYIIDIKHLSKETKIYFIDKRLRGITEVSYWVGNLLLKYDFKLKKDIQLFLLGGGYYSTSSHGITTGTTDIGFVVTTYTPFNVDFYTADYGFILGAELGIKLKTGQIKIDARFSNGLPNLYGDRLKTNPDEKLFSQSIGVGIGYQFNF